MQEATKRQMNKTHSPVVTPLAQNTAIFLPTFFSNTFPGRRQLLFKFLSLHIPDKGILLMPVLAAFVSSSS